MITNICPICREGVNVVIDNRGTYKCPICKSVYKDSESYDKVTKEVPRMNAIIVITDEFETTKDTSLLRHILHELNFIPKSDKQIYIMDKDTYYHLGNHGINNNYTVVIDDEGTLRNANEVESYSSDDIKHVFKDEDQSVIHILCGADLLHKFIDMINTITIVYYNLRPSDMVYEKLDLSKWKEEKMLYDKEMSKYLIKQFVRK